MTIVHAFIDQIIFGLFLLVVCYPQKDSLPDSFYKSGVYILLIVIFVFGTWFRWYYQMPLIGAIGYLFE